MRVFYSWQSDLDPRVSRNIVEAAIKTSIKALNVHGHVEARLDRDLRGLPGTPDIVDAILTKIDSSQAFVADVSLTAVTPAGDPMANSNVMFELGYAVKQLGWGRIVLVVNEAFGRTLPFDLGRTRRWPIRFELADTSNHDTLRRTRATLSTDIQRALYEIAQQERVRGLAPAGPASLDLSNFFLGASGFPGPLDPAGRATVEVVVHGLQALL